MQTFFQTDRDSSCYVFINQTICFLSNVLAIYFFFYAYLILK